MKIGWINLIMYSKSFVLIYFIDDNTQVRIFSIEYCLSANYNITYNISISLSSFIMQDFFYNILSQFEVLLFIREIYIYKIKTKCKISTRLVYKADFLHCRICRFVFIVAWMILWTCDLVEIIRFQLDYFLNRTLYKCIYVLCVF